MLYADSKETVPKQEFSRRFAKENITKNQALDVKRNLKLLENVSITNMCRNRVSYDTLFFIPVYVGKVHDKNI